MARDVDVVVMGCGPAGERAAIQAARAGKRAVVVERFRVVGGNRVNWGTIPSKTLRESALFFHSLSHMRLHGIRYEIAPEVTVADFMHRERLVKQRELDLLNQSLGRYRVEVVEGHARFVTPHQVEVLDQAGSVREELTAAVVVIATGSRPHRPDDVPFNPETVFDSETILALPRMPRSMIVMGAGVIGIEYASIFAALGLDVTLVDTRERLLPYLDREIVGILEQELRRLGITILSGDRHVAIAPIAGAEPRVSCRIEHEADRLDDLVGQLLTLSRLEAGVTSDALSRTERTDLGDLIASIAGDADFEAQAGGRRVVFTGGDGIVADARVELLHRAIENVVRNAVRHTAPGTSVEVTLATSGPGDAAVVTVSDRGPGVAEPDLEAIFEPFFRGAGGRGGQGFGLGLAIARRAIEAHGGRVRARNRPGGGLIVEIDLPLEARRPASG